ncbi:hypothetical protein KI387_028532 [Taxus chinensis]|uniref:Uncharacterized protein n=1 Tax=Taxus chinensis TaxID=29808 RepID=A0AA38CAP9_TAXCH|nr:hypothetical protein KI387_028532 [Taxus chinensis]
MVPEGSIIVESDVSSKGLSWVDRMYQKFEHICEEVDKNPSHLIQETTKYVENQVSIAGANVRKICEEVIQEILPPAPEVAIKSLSSIITVDLDLEEKFMIAEKSKPDYEQTKSLITKSVDPYNLKQDFADVQKEPDCAFSSCETLQKGFPFNPQDADSDLSSLNTGRQLPSPSLQQTLAEKQHVTLKLEAENCTEDACGIRETASFSLAEPMMKQQRESTQLDVLVPADKTGKMSLEETPKTKDKRNSNAKDGERVLTAVEPFTESRLRFSKLNSTMDESEQSAYWYESESIDISASNPFYEVARIDKYYSPEDCDSDWELL